LYGGVAELFEVIHETPDLLVINKPAGLVCHPTKTDEYSSLISRVRLYLRGSSRPQLVNRLDRETSGVTLVAKNEAAARQLRHLWEGRAVDKEYLAIAHGHVKQKQGTIDAPLGKDERSRVAIKDCVRADGAAARTDFWVEKTFERSVEALDPSTTQPSAARSSAVTSLKGSLSPRPFSLLRVLPHTGRKHQIRIHLAHIGHPIVGDKLYGGDEDLYMALVESRLSAEQWGQLILPHHALHALEVRFIWQGQQQLFRAEPEPWFSAFVR
jgi:23S rRNA pseudouridine1911/1915/1917 synthase